ncbi:fasciclin domain-containing protein, partial [bacterium]
PKKILDSILSRPAVLREVLEYHVIPADANLPVLRDNIEIPTQTGYAIRFRKRGSLSRLDNAPVAQSIRASNGVILVVNQVLLPPRFTGRTD